MALVKIFEGYYTPMLLVDGVNATNFEKTVVEALKGYTFCRTKHIPSKKVKELQQAFFECANYNKANRYFSPTDEENVYQFDDMKIEFEIFNDTSLYEEYDYNNEELTWE